MEHLTESDAHVAETRCRREKVLPTTRRVARQNLLNEARKGEISCISEMAKLTAAAYDTTWGIAASKKKNLRLDQPASREASVQT